MSEEDGRRKLLEPTPEVGGPSLDVVRSGELHVDVPTRSVDAMVVSVPPEEVQAVQVVRESIEQIGRDGLLDMLEKVLSGEVKLVRSKIDSMISHIDRALNARWFRGWRIRHVLTGLKKELSLMYVYNMSNVYAPEAFDEDVMPQLRVLNNTTAGDLVPDQSLDLIEGDDVEDIGGTVLAHFKMFSQVQKALECLESGGDVYRHKHAAEAEHLSSVRSYLQLAFTSIHEV